MGEDSFGLWHASSKRPSTDRHFNPNDKNNLSAYEESKGVPSSLAFSLSAPTPIRSLLDSDPLVKSESGNKIVLDLPIFFLKAEQIALLSLKIMPNCYWQTWPHVISLQGKQGLLFLACRVQ